ncbi:MAG: TAXI family TRAP transporter solute-binding subunit [Desulfotomaculaceae bacterium]|nr:TAXI family TRAP transporter solute-binding subunit [Desulfotomaculaceae bacterium]
MGSGIGTVLSKHLSKEVKVVATTGPAEWFPMLETKEMDLGVLNDWDAQKGWLGESVYEQLSQGKGFPCSLLTVGTPALCGVTVANDSGIRTGEDLKGKRFVVDYTGAPGVTAQAEASLANFGLTRDDVKVLSMPSANAGIQAITEGRADATGSGNIGMGVVSELDAKRGARFLSYDNSPEAVKRLQDIYYSEIVEVQPGPANIGVQEPTNMMRYYFYLVGRKDLSEEEAYNIVKTLWDQNQELGAIHVKLQEWATNGFVNPMCTIPYHPGAVKFYQEKGVWTPEMEERQAQLLAQKQ